MDELKCGDVVISVRDQWAAEWSGCDWGFRPTLGKRYYLGNEPPNYPVPATMSDVEYDLEYVWLLHERARLTKELRDVRGDTIN